MTVLDPITRPTTLIERAEALGAILADRAQRLDDTDAFAAESFADLKAQGFLEAGVPAVECGPKGGGHHGPEEWVSIRSLGQYRAALVEFVDLLAARRLKIA